MGKMNFPSLQLFSIMAIHVICFPSLSPQSLSEVYVPVNFGSGTEAAQNGPFPSLLFWGQHCAHRKQICTAFFMSKAVEVLVRMAYMGFHI